LRYWETEFPMLAPEKDENDQRRYRRNDIELILEIKRLLYTEKFTIAGARKQLRAKNTAPQASAAAPTPEMVRQGGPAAQTTLPEGDKRTRIQSSLSDLRNDVDELFRFMA
jgi:DNA-binding transcriptional MerR regulator